MQRLNALGKASLIALSVMALGAAAAAAQSKMDAVTARQAAMKSFGGDSKAIGDYIKGAGDKDAAAKAANDIAATAVKLEGLWPTGTSSTDMPGMTKAKAEIWSDAAGFTARFASMSTDATKLAGVIAAGTPDDVKAAQGAFAKANCGACHMTYREAEAPRPN